MSTTHLYKYVSNINPPSVLPNYVCCNLYAIFNDSSLFASLPVQFLFNEPNWDLILIYLLQSCIRSFQMTNRSHNSLHFINITMIMMMIVKQEIKQIYI